MGDGAARLHTAQLLRRTALFSKHIKSFFRRFSNAVFRIQDESWQDIRTFFLGFSFASFVATASYVPTTIITALLAKATERVWLMLWKQTYFSCFKSHPYKNPFLTYASIFHYFISGRFPIRTKRSIHQTRTIGRGVLCHRFQRIQQVSFIKQEKLFQLATTLLRGEKAYFWRGTIVLYYVENASHLRKVMSLLHTFSFWALKAWKAEAKTVAWRLRMHTRTKTLYKHRHLQASCLVIVCRSWTQPVGGGTVCRPGWFAVTAELAESALVNQFINVILMTSWL